LKEQGPQQAEEGIILGKRKVEREVPEKEPRRTPYAAREHHTYADKRARE